MSGGRVTRKAPSPFWEEGFAVRDRVQDRQVKTKVYIIQGLDLSLEQTGPDGEKVYLSHYSNPGITTFSLFLKFLHVSQVRVPEIRPPQDRRKDDFVDGARSATLRLAMLRFPIKYEHGLPNAPAAIASVNYQTGGDPNLEIRTWSGTMVFSLGAARKMVEKIPQLYPPFANSFYTAYQTFLSEAQKHADQIISVKELRRQRGKQLQFPLFDARREQQDK